jgi:hypothetical protein
MADAVYDSMRINDDIKQLNITPIIWRSRRAKNLHKFNQKDTSPPHSY